MTNVTLQAVQEVEGSKGKMRLKVTFDIIGHFSLFISFILQVTILEFVDANPEPDVCNRCLSLWYVPTRFCNFTAGGCVIISFSFRLCLSVWVFPFLHRLQRDVVLSQLGCCILKCVLPGYATFSALIIYVWVHNDLQIIMFSSQCRFLGGKLGLSLGSHACRVAALMRAKKMPGSSRLEYKPNFLVVSFARLIFRLNLETV